MRFRDRADAGRQLAKRLAVYGQAQRRLRHAHPPGHRRHAAMPIDEIAKLALVRDDGGGDLLELDQADPRLLARTGLLELIHYILEVGDDGAPFPL